MDIHSARQKLRTSSIYDVEMRVTFYARVSSESDEQINSLENQVSYYKDLIQKNQKWTFIPGYVDEGISGMSTKKREQFNKMIEDAQAGKFDLIITKEISRFARNTLDSIMFTRNLLSSGVGVFFQNDGINTLDEDAELRLSIMSSIAQDELRKLSSRIRFGHQQAIKSHVVLGNNKITGYKKENKRLVIDEEEAPIVRELFTLYATDQYSMKQIEDIFWEKGYRNTNGNRIKHTTMSGVIANPKYKGYYVGNRVRVLDMFTKKQQFLPPEEWVMFKDETGEIVPAIVSEEVWDKANDVLRRRSDDVKNRKGICNHANLLTGKVMCSCCNMPYYRRESKDKQGHINSKWICSGKIINGADSCKSFPIYEDEIKPVLFNVFGKTHSQIAESIDEYIRIYRSTCGDNSVAKEIESNKGRVSLLCKKRDKLLEYNAIGKISDEDFLQMNEDISAEIKELNNESDKLSNKKRTDEEFSKHINEIKNVLLRAEADAKDGVITKEFVDKYIDKIYVTPITDDSMKISVKIFTGETTIESLKRAESRTGHTFKNICPIQTNLFFRKDRTSENHLKQYTYKANICIKK